MRVTKWMAAVTAVAALAVFPVKSHAGIYVNISIAPPGIPVYEQPVAPGPDYIWTPGYWQWDPEVGDYFWVPGTWVVAPQVGYLWTPGYWAFDSGFYGWHGGYWGPHIGYYGGVNYGCGYFGRGYEGGYWNGQHFFYNTAISRVNVVNVHNTYVHNVTVVNNMRTSYVGGNGLQSRPTGGEQAALREQHVTATAQQQQHMNFARQDRSQFAQQNHGAPPAAALVRPATNLASFHQAAIAGRAGGTYTPQTQRTQVVQPQRGLAGSGPQGSQQRGLLGGNASSNGNDNRGGNTNGNLIQGQPRQQRYDNRQPLAQSGQQPQPQYRQQPQVQPQYRQPQIQAQPQYRQPPPAQEQQQPQYRQPPQVPQQQRPQYRQPPQVPQQQQQYRQQPQAPQQPQQQPQYRQQQQAPQQPQQPRQQPQAPQQQSRPEAAPRGEPRGGGERR